MLDHKFSLLADDSDPQAKAQDGVLASDPFIRKRLKLYLGNAVQLTQGEYVIAYAPQSMLCHSGMNLEDMERAYRTANRRPVAKILTIKNYAVPLVELHRKFSIEEPFLLIAGDTRDSLSVPAFAKSRTAQHPGNSFLLPLNSNRHWMPIREVLGNDIPFKNKRDQIVWRGTTTGLFKRRRGYDMLGSRASVPRAIKRFSSDWLDIGYSSVIIPREQTEIPIKKLQMCIREKIDIRDQLQYKYILSLEGNDVSSGLKWALYSNSVVIMPHPTVESWACESLLVPYHHYIPVRHDLSDLETVFGWCSENEDKCEEIARNGSNFIKRFLVRRTEMRIVRRVIMEYHRRVRLVPDDPHPDGLSK